MAIVRRSVLITGCSPGGLGEELAKHYHARGLRVFATARNIATLESLSALGIETFCLDVTQTESIHSARNQLEQLTGGILNILVNNAGTTYPYAAVDMSMDEVKKVYDVNIFGPMAMVKEFIPMLVASGDACVVNIGSLSAVLPMPFNCAYASSKAALHSFNDMLRVELAPFDIRVLLAVSGNIQTNITKTWHRLPENSMYKPIDTEYRRDRLDNFQVGATPRATVAAQIVAESLQENPRAWLWLAFNSWWVWFGTVFFSRTGFDSITSKRFGLTKLSRILHSYKGKTT